MPFAATWMDAENVILSEVSQLKTNIIYCLYMHLKNWVQINLQNRNRVTDVEGKHGCQGQGLRGVNWETGLDI